MCLCLKWRPHNTWSVSCGSTTTGAVGVFSVLFKLPSETCDPERFDFSWNDTLLETLQKLPIDDIDWDLFLCKCSGETTSVQLFLSNISLISCVLMSRSESTVSSTLSMFATSLSWALLGVCSASTSFDCAVLSCSVSSGFIYDLKFSLLVDFCSK